MLACPEIPVNLNDIRKQRLPTQCRIHKTKSSVIYVCSSASGVVAPSMKRPCGCSAPAQPESSNAMPPKKILKPRTQTGGHDTLASRTHHIQPTILRPLAMLSDIPGITRPLRLGSDCTGTGVEVLCAEGLNVLHEHIFASDTQSSCRVFVSTVCGVPTCGIYNNIEDRMRNCHEQVDMYVGGSPVNPSRWRAKERASSTSLAALHSPCYSTCTWPGHVATSSRMWLACCRGTPTLWRSCSTNSLTSKTNMAPLHTTSATDSCTLPSRACHTTGNESTLLGS